MFTLGRIALTGGLVACAVSWACAAGPAPVLRADSNRLGVREGTRSWPGVWVVSADTALDTYDAQPSAFARRITFYSGIDSLSFAAVPGQHYDFVIRLPDSTDHHTRVSTRRQGSRRAESVPAGQPVEIPLTFASNHKPRVRGSLNGSPALDLLFDTGASMSVLYPSGLKKAPHVAWDGATENFGSGGTTTRRISGDNHLEISNLAWDHVPLLFVERQSEPVDGIVGPDLFLDKVLEMDFARGVLVVHDSLPALPNGFARLDLHWDGNTPLIEATLDTGVRKYDLWLVLDTGANGAIGLGHESAQRDGLPGRLEKLGSSRTRGVGNSVLAGDLVLFPAVSIGGFELRDVPAFVERPAPGRLMADWVGTELLKRFHLYIDFPHDAVYLRPGPGFATAFNRPGPPAAPAGWAVAAAFAVLAAWLVGRMRRASRN